MLTDKDVRRLPEDEQANTQVSYDHYSPSENGTPDDGERRLLQWASCLADIQQRWPDALDFREHIRWNT